MKYATVLQKNVNFPLTYSLSLSVVKVSIFVEHRFSVILLQLFFSVYSVYSLKTIADMNSVSSSFKIQHVSSSKKLLQFLDICFTESRFAHKLGTYSMFFTVTSLPLLLYFHLRYLNLNQILSETITFLHYT